MTAILEEIRRFVERLAPAPACDVCLADRLDPSAADGVRTAIGELSGERGFVRTRDACGLCEENRMVIRKRT